MYTTNPQGFVVTRPQVSPGASSPRSRNRSSQTAPARPAQRRPTSARDFFAPNLQIHFRIVRLGEMTGAKLTRSPSANSPVRNVLVDGSPMYLEANDVILHLDSLPIRGAADILNHHSETTVTFLDHQSGRIFNGVMMLPTCRQATYDGRR